MAETIKERASDKPRNKNDMKKEHTVLRMQIRIGYLNRQVEENIEVYKKMYDIVLVRDETLDIPIQITKYCFSH